MNLDEFTLSGIKKELAENEAKLDAIGWKEAVEWLIQKAENSERKELPKRPNPKPVRDGLTSQDTYRPLKKLKIKPYTPKRWGY